MTVLTAAGVRCRDLDRYLKRLAKHPTVRKDPDFRLEFCNFDMDDKYLSTSTTFEECFHTLSISEDTFVNWCLNTVSPPKLRCLSGSPTGNRSWKHVSKEPKNFFVNE